MCVCLCVSLSGGITVTAELHCKALTRGKSAALKYYYVPAPRVGGIKRWCASDICLMSVCRVCIGPKSRTERPRKIKIGTEVPHVTRDSDTTFKIKMSKVNLLLMS